MKMAGDREYLSPVITYTTEWYVLELRFIAVKRTVTAARQDCEL